MNHWSYRGNFRSFIEKFDSLRLLEINGASGLTRWLAKMSNRQLAEYPEIDMQSMPYPDASFDIVVHSDTLEHVENPIQALSECRRVLRPAGVLAFTIPIIVGRMTRSRKGLAKSYHGSIGNRSDDFVVHTEYGADMWQQVIAAGFKSVKIDTFDYPAGIAISASETAPTPTSSLPTRIWKAFRSHS
jgi:SAM-dependent methyltransferase